MRTAPGVRCSFRAEEPGRDTSTPRSAARRRRRRHRRRGGRGLPRSAGGGGATKPAGAVRRGCAAGEPVRRRRRERRRTRQRGRSTTGRCGSRSSAPRGARRAVHGRHGCVEDRRSGRHARADSLGVRNRRHRLHTAAYARRWRHHFCTWCDRNGVVALPAAPVTVMAYLTQSGDGPNRRSARCAGGSPRSPGPCGRRVPAAWRRPRHGGPDARAVARAWPRRARRPDLRAAHRGPTRCLPTPRPAVHGRCPGLRAAAPGRGRAKPWRRGTAALGRQHRDRGPTAPAPARRAQRPSPSPSPELYPQASAAVRAAAAALVRWQELAGLDPPWVFTGVDSWVRRSQQPMGTDAIRRTLLSRCDSLTATRVPSPAAMSRAAQVLDGPDNACLRDRALILLGFADAFRRIDLASLVWADLRVRPGGVVVRLRRSKTDVTGRGRDAAIPHGSGLGTCPVRALSAWRARCRQQLGADWSTQLPVFLDVGSAGRLRAEAITPEGITQVVRRRTREAGLPGHWGGRSLRAGFISTAADLDIPLEAVAAQSRRASLDNLIRYIRRGDTFRRATPLTRSACDSTRAPPAAGRCVEPEARRRGAARAGTLRGVLRRAGAAATTDAVPLYLTAALDSSARRGADGIRGADAGRGYRVVGHEPRTSCSAVVKVGKGVWHRERPLNTGVMRRFVVCPTRRLLRPRPDPGISSAPAVSSWSFPRRARPS